MEKSREIINQAEVVAFDWDGTVVDSVPYKLLQNQDIAREFGNELSMDEVRRVWNAASGFENLMKELCQTDDMEAIMKVAKRDYDNPEYAKRPFDFSPVFLRTVRELGKKTVLITNVTRELLTADSESVNLSPLDLYFDYTQTADESRHKKPDPRVFDKMLEKFQISAENVVYIGDEMKDYEAARDANIEFIGVHTGMASEEEFRDAGTFSVGSLKDIKLRG